MARQTHCKISTTSYLIQHHFNIFLPIEMQRLNTLLILTLASSANGYSLNARRNGHDSKLSTVNDRRVFLGSSVMAGFTFFTSMPAFADADLSMPSEAEQAEMQKAEMEARLRRKAELQKKASKPQTFGESLKGEITKQKSLEKTKQERRDAMCEELGRGC